MVLGCFRRVLGQGDHFAAGTPLTVAEVLAKRMLRSWGYTLSMSLRCVFGTILPITCWLCPSTLSVAPSSVVRPRSSVTRHAAPLAVGVPLGGIGCGSVEILPNGRFSRATINNNWESPIDSLGDALRRCGREAATKHPHMSFRPRRSTDFQAVLRSNSMGISLVQFLRRLTPICPSASP